MEINLYLCYAIVGFCFVILPTILLFCVKERRKMNICAIVLFCVYAMVLCLGVFGRVEFTKSTVRLGLDFSGQWCSKSINWNFAHLSAFDVVINLFMLVPVGFFVTYFLVKKWKIWQLLIFLLLPIPRSVQLSGIVFNSISVFIGGISSVGIISIATTKQSTPYKWKK